MTRPLDTNINPQRTFFSNAKIRKKQKKDSMDKVGQCPKIIFTAFDIVKDYDVCVSGALRVLHLFEVQRSGQEV
jgi:hypothetical protein